MIGEREAALWAGRFGVAVEQIQRDHLVSHVLASLPSLYPDDEVHFIGGTALARTHLDGLRVSEDVDLLVRDPVELAGVLRERLPRLLRRDYPDLVAGIAIPAPRGRRILLNSGQAFAAEVQLIKIQPDDAILTLEERHVSLRYAGLPSHVALNVPTADSFVAMKFAAFRDRQVPRDLFDLAHLASQGAITPAASALLRRLTGVPCTTAELRTLPPFTARTWNERLAHQTGHLLSAASALEQVRTAVAEIER